MRGSPLLRALVVFLGLLALAPLLWNLTRKTEAQTVPQAATVKAAGIEGRWTFSAKPERIAVQHLGREIWSKASPGDDEKFSTTIPWPKEGVELRVLVGWSDATRNAAARLRLVSPDGTEYDRTVWGSGAADEILTFP